MSKLEILFEDEYIIAIDKPSGLLSIPDRTGTLPNAYTILGRDYPDLKLVHRLDRDTSGAMIFAKSTEVQRELSSLFEAHKVDKKYLALVVDSPKIKEGIIDNFLEENPNQKGSYRIAYNNKGKRAISHYKVVEQFKKASLMEFEIKTGRTHQIRVHAAFLGSPLIYDPIYNPRSGLYVSQLKPKFTPKDGVEERPIIQRLSLHALSIDVNLENFDKSYSIVSPIPKDFQKAITILEKYSR